MHNFILFNLSTIEDNGTFRVEVKFVESKRTNKGEGNYLYL